MKKIVPILSIIFLLFLSGCGTKVPYKVQEPLKEASLVYVYVTSINNFGENLSESSYQIRINNKKTTKKIMNNEYIAFNLKTGDITISVTRTQIEERSIKLHLEAGKTYYLRIKTDIDDGGFEFEEVKKSVGIQEIVKTNLAGATQEDNNSTKSPLIQTETQDEKKDTLSKTDEIKKAYELKNQGIISNEEFEALKKEILAK